LHSINAKVVDGGVVPFILELVSGCELTASFPGLFTHVERAPRTHGMRMGVSRSLCEVLKKTKNVCYCWESKGDSSVIQSEE
jgi:hypothetical protein